VLVVAMIFLVIFSALAVSMATMANTQTQVAQNQHRVNSALLAAQSGLELAKYAVRNIDLPSTNCDIIRPSDAAAVWAAIGDSAFYTAEFGA